MGHYLSVARGKASHRYQSEERSHAIAYPIDFIPWSGNIMSVISTLAYTRHSTSHHEAADIRSRMKRERSEIVLLRLYPHCSIKPGLESRKQRSILEPASDYPEDAIDRPSALGVALRIWQRHTHSLERPWYYRARCYTMTKGMGKINRFSLARDYSCYLRNDLRLWTRPIMSQHHVKNAVRSRSRSPTAFIATAKTIPA